jgi:type IV pilus assembly protein PilE
MIVVAIVGILAAIAYPSYQDQVRKTRRADAHVALTELAQFMARYHATHDTYAGASLPFTEAPKESGTKFYDLSFSAGPDATSYTLQAAPKGAQSGDICGTMTLSSTGVKGAARTDCWRR